MLTLFATMIAELTAIAIVAALAWLLHRMVLRYLGGDHRRSR